MLIGVIQAKDIIQAKSQIKSILNQVDGIELRLDYWPEINIAEIAQLRQEFSLPIIFTLRKKSQGGNYLYDEDKRLSEILALCELKPDFLDLENDVDQYFIQKLHEKYPDIKLICSYHDFKHTPDDLVKTFNLMQNSAFAYYKIATMANNIVDALRMLNFLYSKKLNNLTGICMGEFGAASRILGPVMGNAFNFACVSEEYKTAPGQFTVQDLRSIYHFQKLNSHTKIYALLGDPVDKSVGHILHNQAIELLAQNAVYIKLKISPEELPEAIKLCRQLPFAGFSITMPLKEPIGLLLDKIDPTAQKIKAINSIIINDQQWLGFNTDGEGAIQAIAERIDLNHQKIVILGAGGSAKAIAYAAIQRNAEIIILNRTVSKAQELAKELNCQSGGLDQLAELKNTGYSVIINTLPFETLGDKSAIKSLIKPEYFLAGTIAMDIVYNPINTAFLQIAKHAGCICIPGYEMYINQALLQIQRWFEPTENKINQIKNMMQQFFLEKI